MRAIKTKGLCLILGVWQLVGLIHGAFAADNTALAKPGIAPPDSWVKPHFFDPQSVLNRPDASADQHWLLLERQINAATNETFIHRSRQILTVAGVQDGSSLKIDFNPGYQTLILHWVRLWRGTNHLDQLNADKIRVVRQERDLDQDILDGSETAMLVLDDVRVGDIVDYAYSLKGENPVYNSRFSASFNLQLDEPVERLYTRVVWPADRRFFSKAFNCSLQPVVIKTNGLIDCTWDLQRVPGFHREDAMPGWCDPEPWVQITEFKSWAEVNQWALALFQDPSPLSADLKQHIAVWKQLPGHEQQILAVLRFVQDQIRYFGIEIGINAAKPTDPSTVFSRRYGDCKDKSLLFVTLLRALGIEAYPVLVNTQARRTIAGWEPAAGAFDHCISVVRCDGNTWWLDPTAGYQRGTLAQHYLPNYGYGLVISPMTAGLTAIPQVTGLPLTTTTEFFNLGHKSGMSELKVMTVSEGRDADVMREMLATTKRADIEKSYTHFYNESYPGTKMAASMDVQDDEQQNRITTTEYYTIDQAWIKSGPGGEYRCDFYPSSIAALDGKPVDAQRSQPLAVPFPQHRIVRTIISLSPSWTYHKENIDVTDPAFLFAKRTYRDGKNLVIEYEYKSLRDSVPPARVTEYLQNLDAVSKHLGYEFLWK